MTGSQLMQPVFHFLDGLIRDWGDYLDLALVYASMPLIAWILSGGLRRKRSRQDASVTIPIVIILTPARPPPLPPPIIGSEADPFPDDDGDSFAA